MKKQLAVLLLAYFLLSTAACSGAAGSAGAGTEANTSGTNGTASSTEGEDLTETAASAEPSTPYVVEALELPDGVETILDLNVAERGVAILVREEDGQYHCLEYDLELQFQDDVAVPLDEQTEAICVIQRSEGLHVLTRNTDANTVSVWSYFDYLDNPWSEDDLWNYSADDFPMETESQRSDLFFSGGTDACLCYLDQKNLLRLYSSAPDVFSIEATFYGAAELDPTLIVYGQSLTQGEGRNWEVYIGTLDIEALTVTKQDTLEISAPVVFEEYEKTRLYLSADGALYACDGSAQSLTELFSWSDLGIYGGNLLRGAVVGGKILAATDTAVYVVRDSAQDASQASEKPITLNLAVLSDGAAACERAASLYNGSQTNYRVNIVSYEDVGSLGLAFAAKEDIDLVSVYFLPYTSYAAKGVFEDLSPWLEQDSELKSSLYPSVLAACTTGEHVYSLIATFTLKGMAAPQSLVGDRYGWTLEEFQTYAEGTGTYQAITKSLLLSGLRYDSTFIDEETNTALFDTQEFLDFLSFCNRFADDDERVWSDDCIAQVAYLTDAELLSMGMYDDFNWSNEGVAYLGFPSENVEGMQMDTAQGLELAMVSYSEQKEGAWDFLQFVLSEDYLSQTNAFNSRMDLTAASLQELVEAETLTQAQAEQVDAILSHVSSAIHYDTTIQDIFEEESAWYFSGEKTAEEVAEILQNRVQLYLDEQS